jgi:hypothetical protein
MASTPIDLNAAIRDGTLGSDACIIEVHKRRHLVATDPELLPNIRNRDLLIFDTAIATAVPKAISEGQLVVSILQSGLMAIGLLYVENEQWVARLVSESSSTV